MKEQIEKVIAELEEYRSEYEPTQFEDEYEDGIIMALTTAINSLKAVLADGENAND